MWLIPLPLVIAAIIAWIRQLAGHRQLVDGQAAIILTLVALVPSADYLLREVVGRHAAIALYDDVRMKVERDPGYHIDGSSQFDVPAECQDFTVVGGIYVAQICLETKRVGDARIPTSLSLNYELMKTDFISRGFGPRPLNYMSGRTNTTPTPA